MKLFVTGATGAVGVPAVAALTAAGHEVTAVARTPEKAEAVRALGATPVEVDLFDAVAVKDAVAGHDAVINLATKIPSATKAARAKNWTENERIRREVSANLADAVIDHGQGTLIQESVAFAYADGGDRWLTEEEPLAPPDFIGAMVQAEANARRVTEAGGTGVVLRFGNFYGPAAGHSMDMLKMIRRRLSPLLGDPEGYWPTIHLDDARAAVAAALSAPAGAYHVVDDEPLTKSELGRAMADALGVKPPRPLPKLVDTFAAKRGPVLARSYRASNAKLKDATGWAPRYPTAREGWAATVAALREQG